MFVILVQVEAERIITALKIPGKLFVSIPRLLLAPSSFFAISFMLTFLQALIDVTQLAELVGSLVPLDLTT